MAWNIGGIAERRDVMNQFISRLKNQILSGSFESREHSSGVVPYSYLGSISEFDVTESMFGDSRHIAKGPGSGYGSVYGALTYMTKMLLKIGSYSYTSGVQPNISTSTGRVIFSNSAVLTVYGVLSIAGLPIAPPLSGVEYLKPTTIASINSLLDNCINAYRSTPKLKYTYVDTSCHGDCHKDETTKVANTPSSYWHTTPNPPVVSSPQGHPNCYDNSGWVYGWADQFHDNVCHGSNPQYHEEHEDEGTKASTCHTNYSSLGLDSYCHI